MPHGLIPRVRQAEVLPVPHHRIDQAWQPAKRWLKRIPGFDLDAARARLLSGEDQLWLAVITEGNPYAEACTGVLLTSVRDTPPIHQTPSNTPKAFQRKDPALRRSLVVHLAEGRNCGLWVASAVARISAYGREQGCRMLFVLAKRAWRKYAVRFWSPEWEVVGLSRDRPVPLRNPQGRNHSKRLQRVGWYRVLQPVEKMTPQRYENSGKCYFEERAP